MKYFGVPNRSNNAFVIFYVLLFVLCFLFNDLCVWELVLFWLFFRIVVCICFFHRFLLRCLCHFVAFLEPTVIFGIEFWMSFVRRPKSNPRAAKSGPRAPKSGPRAPKSTQERPKSGPREAKRGSRAPQERPRAAKICMFWLVLLSFSEHCVFETYGSKTKKKQRT